MKKPTAGTVARTIILGVAIVNNTLAIAGKSPLPFSNEEITEVVSFCFTSAAAIVAWWKNNSFTQKAIEADETMK